MLRGMSYQCPTDKFESWKSMKSSILSVFSDVKFIRWPAATHTVTRHSQPLLPPPNLAHIPNTGGSKCMHATQKRGQMLLSILK